MKEIALDAPDEMKYLMIIERKDIYTEQSMKGLIVTEILVTPAEVSVGKQ